MQCDGSRACVFPAFIGGLCKTHYRELDYPFSLPEISDMYRLYQHDQLVVTNGGYGGTGVVAGFSIDDNSHGTMWQNRLRYGKWKRKAELWIHLDQQAAIRKYSREHDGDLPPAERIKRAHARLAKARLSGPEKIITEAEAVALADLDKRIAQVRQMESEEYRRAVEERKAERHANAKWRNHVDACAELKVGQSIKFQAEGDSKKFSVKLRGALGMARDTRYGRWSVKSTNDGEVLVVKTGLFVPIWEQTNQ